MLSDGDEATAVQKRTKFIIHSTNEETMGYLIYVEALLREVSGEEEAALFSIPRQHLYSDWGWGLGVWGEWRPFL